MNSLYMENHTHQLSIRENHTSTLYTHLDKLRQVNLSTYAQLKVPHTFEFKWYKNEETFTNLRFLYFQTIKTEINKK